MDGDKEIGMDDKWEELRHELEESLIRISSCLSLCNSCSIEDDDVSTHSESVAILRDSMLSGTEDPKEPAGSDKRLQKIRGVAVSAKALNLDCKGCRRFCSNDLKRIEYIEELLQLLWEMDDKLWKMDGKTQDMQLEIREYQEKVSTEVAEIGFDLNKLGDAIKEISNRIAVISDDVKQHGIRVQTKRKLDELRNLIETTVGSEHRPDFIKKPLDDLHEDCLGIMKWIADNGVIEKFREQIPNPDSSMKINIRWLILLASVYPIASIAYFVMGRQAWSWVGQAITMAVPLIASSITIGKLCFDFRKRRTRS